MDQNRNEVSISISNHSSLNKGNKFNPNKSMNQLINVIFFITLVNHQASNPDDIKVVEENEIEMKVYDSEEYESGNSDIFLR